MIKPSSANNTSETATNSASSDSLQGPGVKALVDSEKVPVPQTAVGTEASSSGVACAGDDKQLFKAVPIAVRQPLRLPKHAAHIFDSRLGDTADTKEDEGNVNLWNQCSCLIDPKFEPDPSPS